MGTRALRIDDSPAARCPLGICDGSGFVNDEATRTATDCPCRSQRIAAARSRLVGSPGRRPRKPSSASRALFPPLTAS